LIVIVYDVGATVDTNRFLGRLLYAFVGNVWRAWNEYGLHQEPLGPMNWNTGIYKEVVPKSEDRVHDVFLTRMGKLFPPRKYRFLAVARGNLRERSKPSVFSRDGIENWIDGCASFAHPQNEFSRWAA
jgi:hypothetical protein